MINNTIEKGLIWKTPEIEVLRTKLGGTEVEGSVLTYSLKGLNDAATTTKLFEQAKIHQNAGNMVRIKYEQYLDTWPWRGETSRYVKSIDPIVTKPAQIESAAIVTPPPVTPL
jgi:hypothetical protein